MKTAVVCILFIAVATVHPAEKHFVLYDKIEIDVTVSYKRLLKGYTNCLLGQSACSPDAAELKKILPDVIATDCSKCSMLQKDNSKRILRYLIDNMPADWANLEKLYDPSGAYKLKYRERAKKDGIHV